MGWILLIIGLLYIVAGSGFILATAETKDIMRGLIDKVDRRLLAALTLVFSILLLLAAASARHPWFIRLLGLLGLIKGGFILADPNGLWRRAADWTFNLRDQDFRACGIAVVILGTVMVAWIL